MNIKNIWEHSDDTSLFHQETTAIKADRKKDSGQFSGVLNYAEIDVTVKNMEKGDFIMLNDYSQGGEPLNCKGRNTGEGKPDNKEYPNPIYADDGEKYKYYFGNFGIIYNITFENPESTTLKVYPFGHSFATYASILLKDDSGSWRVENISVAEGIATDVDTLYKEKFGKNVSFGDIKNKLINEIKTEIFPKASTTVNINNKLLNYMLPGGNCGCIKFRM